MIDQMTADEKITRAKIQIYRQSPFFAYVLLHMKFQKDNKVPTMGVDKYGNAYWNEEFVSKLNEEELKGLLVHECCHICFLHLERGETKDHQLFNIANDLCVNDILNNNSFRLPEGGLIPERNHSFEIPQLGITIVNIDQKSSEDIYEELYKHAPKINMAFKMGDGEGDGESCEGMPNLTDKQIKDIIEKLTGIDKHDYNDDKAKEKESKGKGNKDDRIKEMKKVIAEAAQIAKQQGKLPAGLERLVDNILDSKINWKEKLYKYVVAQLPFDTSWAIPSKRGAGVGIYLPKVVRESVHIVFSIDTSGSMGVEELSQALGELQSIVQSFANVKIDVLIGDAEMQNTFELTSDNSEDILEIAKGMKGGGGTSHSFVLSHIEENIQDCKLLLAFTDGYSNINELEPPAYDVIWLLSKNSIPAEQLNWGEVIKIGE